ncbi:hypothetical protein [Ruegeria hyattellae]|uniref:hypothetical protein n=1 Tax=Ruegeria hyattellae TaxID=3233337 RepID=UPI00355B74A2
MKTVRSANRQFASASAASSRKIDDTGTGFPVLELVIFACAFGLTGALAAFFLS